MNRPISKLNVLQKISALRSEQVNCQIGHAYRHIDGLADKLIYSGRLVPKNMNGITLTLLTTVTQDATVGPLGIYFYPAAVLAVCALTLLPGPIRMFM